jgi:hypothetical protein
MIPKSYNQDKLAQYQGSKGHTATSDEDRGCKGIVMGGGWAMSSIN